LKVKEMIIMAVDAIRAHESGLRTHMIQAMKAGATTEEILDALETASLPGGGIVISFAMPIYEEIITNKKLLEQ
jgi:alkylhydroperoxidase/carboxymuconolactone decarboxylase family protein YurZ